MAARGRTAFLGRLVAKPLDKCIELLISTPRVRELLYEGKVGDLGRLVESGADEGLISFNHSLRDLIQNDLVALETALAASDKPDELLLALRGYSSGKPKPRDGGLRLAE